MGQTKPELTQAQWERVKEFLPKHPKQPKGGRPWVDDRACFDGILWILRMGARWNDIPTPGTSGVTCWRRLQQWEKAGVWVKAWRAYLGQLDQRGLLNWEEAFVDGSFAQAKRGAPRSVKHVMEMVQSGWWSQAAQEYRSARLSRTPTSSKAN
jgi:transposase